MVKRRNDLAQLRKEEAEEALEQTHTDEGRHRVASADVIRQRRIVQIKQRPNAGHTSGETRKSPAKAIPLFSLTTPSNAVVSTGNSDKPLQGFSFMETHTTEEKRENGSFIGGTIQFPKPTSTVNPNITSEMEGLEKLGLRRVVEAEVAKDKLPEDLPAAERLSILNTVFSKYVQWLGQHRPHSNWSPIMLEYFEYKKQIEQDADGIETESEEEEETQAEENIKTAPAQNVAFGSTVMKPKEETKNVKDNSQQMLESNLNAKSNESASGGFSFGIISSSQGQNGESSTTKNQENALSSSTNNPFNPTVNKKANASGTEPAPKPFSFGLPTRNQAQETVKASTEEPVKSINASSAVFNTRPANVDYQSTASTSSIFPSSTSFVKDNASCDTKPNVSTAKSAASPFTFGLTNVSAPPASDFQPLNAKNTSLGTSSSTGSFFTTTPFTAVSQSPVSNLTQPVSTSNSANSNPATTGAFGSKFSTSNNASVSTNSFGDFGQTPSASFSTINNNSSAANSCVPVNTAPSSESSNSKPLCIFGQSVSSSVGTSATSFGTPSSFLSTSTPSFLSSGSMFSQKPLQTNNTAESIEAGVEEGDAMPAEEKTVVEKAKEDEHQGKEDTILSLEKVKLYRFKNNEWYDCGTHPLKVMKNKETGMKRVVIRNSNTGKLEMNAALYKGFHLKEEAEKSSTQKTCGFTGHFMIEENLTKYLFRLNKQYRSEMISAFKM